MAGTITFHPDEDAQRALDALTADGTAVSTAVRAALIDAAQAQARQQLRAEAEALANDVSDCAEGTQVLRDMETLRARRGLRTARFAGRTGHEQAGSGSWRAR